ncbi:MAG: type II toxin-antitoxin system prevent-host-death family antitoxin, partial [Bacillota bacterium]|nr:type II toxin-antitoxin system prevent-host-death family antitoxin [Bacillota bacterium]
MRVSSTDFQNAVGKYLTLAQKETITITKNGKSVAKLTATSDPQEFIINEAKGNYNVRRHVSYEEYEKIVGNSEKRFELING